MYELTNLYFRKDSNVIFTSKFIITFSKMYLVFFVNFNCIHIDCGENCLESDLLNAITLKSHGADVTESKNGYRFDDSKGADRFCNE